MMKISFLLLLTTITNIAATSNRTRRLLDADKCDIKEYPSTVSFIIMEQPPPNTTQYDCATGNLITLKWVLTFKPQLYHFGNDIGGWIVVAGTNYELPGKTDDFRKIKRTVKNPRHVPDLVLCELDKPFAQNDRIRPAKLPSSLHDIDECDTFTVVGWGTRNRQNDTEGVVHAFKEPGGGLGDVLMCGKAKMASWNSTETDTDVFIYDMKGTAMQCYLDYGLGVFCKGILVGVTTGLITSPSLSSDDCRYAGGRAYYTVLGLPWLRKNAGIEMPTTTGDVTAPNKNKQSNRHHTTAKHPKGQFTRSSTNEETSEISIGQHLKSNHSIYLLLIWLILFL